MNAVWCRFCVFAAVLVLAGLVVKVKAADLTISYPRSGQFVVAQAEMRVMTSGAFTPTSTVWWRYQGSSEWNFIGSGSRLPNPRWVVPNQPNRIIELGLSDQEDKTPESAIVTGLRVSLEGVPTAGFRQHITFTSGVPKDTSLLVMVNNSDLPIAIVSAQRVFDSALYFVLDTVGLVVDPGKEYWATLRYDPSKRPQMNGMMWLATFSTSRSFFTFESSAVFVDRTTSTDDDPESTSVLLAPNPSENAVRYRVPLGYEGGQMSVISASGRIVWSGQISAQEGTIELEGLAAGVYQIVFQKDDTKTTKPLVKF